MKQLSKTQAILVRIVANWPAHLPLCLFAGDERYSLVPLTFKKTGYSEAQKMPIRCNFSAQRQFPFTKGILGLLNYSDLNESLIYHVERVLTINHRTQEIRIHGNGTDDPDYFQIYDEDIEAIISEDGSRDLVAPFQLIPKSTEQDYLQQAEKVIEEIKRGRFYQLNLLRYFEVLNSQFRPSCLEKFFKQSARMSVWLESMDQTVISFSPERFIKITPNKNYSVIDTFPIKGTVPVTEEPENLLNSFKDQAELAMIIDLMRNDLTQICEPGSVKVADKGVLVSNPYVHHLQGHVTGKLKTPLTFGELLSSVFPAGSITGAPKKEVMQAIQEYEKRPRNFFMGSAFYLDEDGYFDSSVLIRTLCKRGETAEYAAGSGLVVKSIPEKELAEISAKCAVLN